MITRILSFKYKGQWPQISAGTLKVNNIQVFTFQYTEHKIWPIRNLTLE